MGPVAATTTPVDRTAFVARPDLWAAVVGQPDAVAALQAAAPHPVHAYLFVGPPGVGKAAAARGFAAALLGVDAAAAGADADRAVALALDGSHPDLHEYAPEGATYSIDRRDGDVWPIIAAASRSPVEGSRKLVVLDEFHTVIGDPRGVFLKTIEEPTRSTIFVLLAEHVPPELVPIASRAVRVEFGPVPEPEIIAALRADGVAEALVEPVAAAAAGSLDRARLLATDDSLVVRRDSWASIPHRVDGTGHTAAVLVDEVVAHIDAAQGPLDDRQTLAREALEEQIEAVGGTKGAVKDLEARHKREVRRHRTDEIRFGLAVVAAEYRDRLATAHDPRPHLEALRRVQAVAEALVRNPNELLQLQALVVSLPPV